MRELNGKTAIVTGASRGLGARVAQELCDAGMNVVLVARSAGALEQVAGELGAHGRRAVTVPADLAEPGAPARIAQAAADAFGQVDVLVNNAGILTVRRFMQQDDAEVEQMVRINLTAGIELARQVLPGMVERGDGHVVMMASLAGRVGTPYESVYAATKGGQIAFVQSLRGELHGTGVSASVICPGFVTEAGMWEDTAGPSGVKAPRLSGSTTPGAVAKATVRAIRRDVPEVYVNRPALRPLIALGEVSPRFRYWFIRRIGVPRAFERVVEFHERRAGQG
jgi:short-subunit dehydrogenase